MARNGFRGWVDPRLGIPSGLFRNPMEAALELGAERILHCEGREILRLDLPFADGPRSCFLYLFRNRSLGRSLRPSYAHHCRAISTRLRACGFETLTVLAALRPSGELLNWNSLMIALELENVHELPSTGHHVFQTHRWAELDDTLIALVADEVSRFHGEGFVHGDLKTRHLLVRSDADGQPKGVAFVDLEKAAHLQWVPAPLRDVLAGRDLVQLVSSLPEAPNGQHSPPTRQRLLDAYFEQRRLPAVRERIIRRILALYGPNGILSQGQTVGGALWKALRNAPRLGPPPPQDPPASAENPSERDRQASNTR